MSKQSLREVMPKTTAWIDEMRDTFGADPINAAIRDGLRGQPTFWAREGPVEIGTRPPEREEEFVPVGVLESIPPGIQETRPRRR